MRIYVRVRKMLMDHKDVYIRMEQVEKHLMKHGEKIELLFSYLNKFMEKEEQPRKIIGYQPGK